MFAPNTATARKPLSTIPPPSSGRRRFWPFQLDVSLTTALALPLTLNRIFILAPYAYRTNRKHPDGPLVATRSAAAYSVTVLLVYVLTTAYLLYDFRHTTPLAIRLFGVIWYGLNTVDYVISKSSFILIGCVSLYKRRRQIEFFVAISRIDKRLRSRCGCSGRRFYNRLAVGYAIMLAVCASIVFISYLTVLQPLAILGLAVASRVILIVMYVVEYSNVLLLYCSFVSSTLMVRARLLLLTGALRAERGSSRAVADLGDALYVYTELCRMIELLGDYFGGMMLMRFAHDFMLCTAAAYNICSLLMLIQHQSPMSFSLLGGVGLLVLHLLQPVSVCVAAELTLAASRDCHRALIAYRVDTAEERELMDSFHYWSLHNAVRFSAAQFVDIDAALLYAILGAMSTYLLILLQFQIEVEKLMEESDTGSYMNDTIGISK